MESEPLALLARPGDAESGGRFRLLAARHCGSTRAGRLACRFVGGATISRFTRRVDREQSWPGTSPNARHPARKLDDGRNSRTTFLVHCQRVSRPIERLPRKGAIEFSWRGLSLRHSRFIRRLAGTRAAFLLLLLLALVHARGEEILYEQHLGRAPYQVVVKARTPDGAVSMILDTGSYYHMFDPTLTAHLTPFQSNVEIQAFGKKATTAAFDPPAISLGDWKLLAIPALAIDLAPVREVVGEDVRGVLGWGAIAGAALRLDFDQQKLQLVTLFEKPASAKPYVPGNPSSEVSYLSMRHDGPSHQLTLRIPLGERRIEWVIDTGSNRAINLRHEIFEQFVAEKMIGHVDEEPNEDAQTAAGAVSGRNGRFLRGELLGVDLAGFPVRETINADSFGIPFLMNFNLTMDFGGSRFYFQRRKAEPPIMHYRMLGAAFSFADGQCQIKKTRAGATESAGLQAGDRILRIGSLSGQDLTLSSVYEFCQTHASQTFEVEYVREGVDGNRTTRLHLPAKVYYFPLQSPP